MSIILTHVDEHRQKVINYYSECWLNRFKEGHNPKSRAMHLGYFDNGSTDNDDAKNKMNELLAAKIGLAGQSDWQLVDAGCGVGGTCVYLAKNFPGVKITGINIASDQIEFAEREVRLAGLTGAVNFISSDYTNTPLATSSVNVVYAVESLCHASDKAEFFAEAMRILQPGGKVIMLDYVLTMPEASLSPANAALLHNFKEGWSVKDYIENPPQYLTQAGFTAIENSSIIDKVFPGIKQSYDKAEAILDRNEPVSANMKKHLLACYALKKLVEDNVIDYVLAYGVKPAL